MTKSSKSKTPAPAFAVGDFVHFEYDNIDYYGTITGLPGNPFGGYYNISVPEYGDHWGALEECLTLILRPDATDQAAEEYLEIIALQDLVGTDI